MNKVLLVCLCVAVALSLFSSVFLLMGWGDLLRDVGATLLYPFQWITSGLQNAIQGFAQYTQDLKDLQAEVRRLTEENQQLQASLQEAELLREEYSWLYAYLSMKEEHASYSFCAAGVVARDMSGAYALELTLNKGSAHGVKEGMPVVTRDGLVGVVSQVNWAFCKVRTILNTTSSAGVAVTRSGEIGVCEGDFEALKNGCAVARYLPAEADVQVGDSLLTSGRGSVYPYGIPVGRVVSISHNGFSRTTEMVIQPFARLDDLDQVMILTAYERYAEGNQPEETVQKEPGV